MKAWFHFLWKQLGSSGRIGVLLLIGVVLLWSVQVLPERENVMKLRSELDAKHLARESSMESSIKPRKLDDFYRNFPKLDILPDQLAALDMKAASMKLKIHASQYQLQPVDNLALQRYQINLSVSGDYPDMRGFLNNILKDIPNAVLDETQFNRDQENGNVAAQFRISFYYQAIAVKVKQ